MAREAENPAGEPVVESPPGPPAATGGSCGESGDTVALAIQTVVRTILELSGIHCRVDVERAGREYYANVRPHLSKGLLIGRRGTTLQAIQYLTWLIVKRKYPGVPPVMVDVGGYRLRRENFLCTKAEAVARIVIETRREMALDPLTDKERLLVDEHLRSLPGIRVYAVTSGTRQNVIIAPK
jgi:spoIIIJ-associated protein